jgi:predicted RNase H-related nuclease YkuK (DUF458 family)
MLFVSPSQGRLPGSEMLQDVRRFIEERPSSEYKIVIGTDSQTDRLSTVFVTAVIVHRVGHGARFYFYRVKTKPIRDLRYRIYTETDYSLRALTYLEGEGFSSLREKWPIEVHLDVGEKGETRKLIHEVVGWVHSLGYEAKIKPYSFGASCVADRYTK